MTSKYPAQIDNSLTLPVSVDNRTPVTGSVTNRLRDAIIAIESELGVKPGSTSTVKGRLDSLSSSINNLEVISLAGDFGGTLSFPLVTGLQGFPISSATPDISDVLIWNGLAWIPGAAPGSGGGSAGNGTVGTIQTTNGIGTLVGATNIKAGTDYLSLGTFPADVGNIRLSGSYIANSRSFDNLANTTILSQDIAEGANHLFIGFDGTGGGFSTAMDNIVIGVLDSLYFNNGAAGTTEFNVDGNPILIIDTSSINIDQPITGRVLGNSPYGIHGVGTQSMSDTNQIVAAAIYCYNTIITTGVITADRTITLPTATDIAGYTKVIDNTCTGAFSIIVSVGAGTTATIANGNRCTVLVDSRGVNLVGIIPASTSVAGSMSAADKIKLDGLSNSSGWTTALDLDYTAQPTQVLATNTTYTIGGITHTKINSAADSTSMQVTSGVGLVQIPVAASAYNGVQRTAPGLMIDLATIIPTFQQGMRIRAWVRVASQNLGSNAQDAAMIVIEPGSYNFSYATLQFKDGGGTKNQQTYMCYNSADPAVNDSTNVTDDVMMIEVTIGDPFVRSYSGLWAGGWPAISAMHYRHVTQADSNATWNLSSLGAAVWDVLLCAGRNGSGTALNVTWGALRVDYK